MERVKTRAIVARRADYSESNCILTLFAERLGVISASVYGVKSNKKGAARATGAEDAAYEELVEDAAGDRLHEA